MKTERIAIVGIGLRYPDATSPGQLWENVLAGRKAFRQHHAGKAAVLRDYEFDRVAHRIPGTTYRSAGPVHWLMLDTVAAALADAGYPDANGLPRRTTGVIVGSNPAGGPANATAGRVCDHFDLAGGGFAVDGASSSLLPVVSAIKALAVGDLDVAIAGGADLSIDPAAWTGADETGWPGEGCGVVVLMRETDAIARNCRIYATITGWGVSADGRGGLTRPTAAGHQLALARAYERAGYGVDTVSYFEGHGTGTTAVDAAELDALSGARRDADPIALPAALGTVKGNIGHTGAAAGVAGLVKAALAVHHQVIPPATGTHAPHAELTQPDAAVYVPDDAALWPADLPVRAGVSAMGFGGVNTHLALEEAPGRERRTGIGGWTTALVTGRQDADLLLVDAHSPAELLARVRRLAALAAGLSTAEVTDLAGTLAIQQRGGAFRAAVVAGDPAEAARRLSRVADELGAGRTELFSPADGVFLAHRTNKPRIAYLFPGQGAGREGGGALRRRFAVAAHLFDMAAVPAPGDRVGTGLAQPLVVAGSIAGLRVLHTLGIDADVAVGHSLGELTALSWGGALDGGDLLRLAAVRGQVMARASRTGGAMASVSADAATVEALAGGRDVVIAAYDGPDRTVIAGPAEDVDAVSAAARAGGLTATRLDVSHAFHSPLVRPAADALAARLPEFDFGELRRPVVSTVTGTRLAPGTDLRALLADQVTGPVRFGAAAAEAVADVDLAIEVGPGRALAGLVAGAAPGTPVLALDTDSTSLAPLLAVTGAAYALGADVDPTTLFADRVIRPVIMDSGTTAEAVPESRTADEVTATSTLDVLRRVIAERTELPAETLTARTHPLDDLHLSSIAVGQLVNTAVQELGRPALTATTSFAVATLGELADLIDQLDETALDGVLSGEVPGYAPWVRPFSVEYVPAERPSLGIGIDRLGPWKLRAPAGHPFAERLRAALAGAAVGEGVLLCLPASGEEHAELVLRAGRAAAMAGQDTRFVVVQQGFGAAGLARTLHLEYPSVRTTVIGLADATPTTPEAVDVAVNNVLGDVVETIGYSEVRYLADGTRTVPMLRAVPGLGPDGPDAAATPLGADDVLLVTGGAKGITAECALAAAQDSGAALALVGRADPTADDEVSANLARMVAAGVRVRYERADVTVAEEVGAAVARIEAAFGPVTAVLHGAGSHEPAALENLTAEQMRGTIAPKVDGLRTVLDAVGEDNVRLLVTFGSIVGRAGLRGSAHYATANDWLTELTVDFGRRHPDARALAIEWSVWSGTGMGEKLGVVEALMREGVTPISLEDGLAVLRRALADAAAPPVLVVSGRTAALPTITYDRRALPQTRFLDRVLVQYPGVELVTEVALAQDSDPYLSDHLVGGDLLFPAVLGMEAMTQVATALSGATAPPLLEDMEFLRPIVVRPGGSTRIRVLALTRNAGSVAVAVRSEETGFATDHFRALVRFTGQEPTVPPPAVPTGLPSVAVDPVTDLYGGILFQGKRFQRLLSYRKVAARRVVAEVATTPQASWFGAFHDQDRVLADPGTRDAVIHSIQCCVPGETLLPARVERLYPADPAGRDPEVVVVDARERERDGDLHVFDVDVLTPSGDRVERWEGLTLCATGTRGDAGPWVPALLGPQLERVTEAVLGATTKVVVEPDPVTGLMEPADRLAQIELAASRALDRRAGVRHGTDGRLAIEGGTVSASHGAGLTVVAVGTGRLACDVEVVTERTEEDWDMLLSARHRSVREQVATEADESAAVAATRIWGALECLRKAGMPSRSLIFDRVTPEGRVVLADGETRIVTWVTTVNDIPDQVVFTVLSGREN
ncbi:SDR family NAD(P)-dependent oxidoreductase [Actinophytocola glycyrrhizae]|uniref:SDR family NAD(P)-dependent oxidoreductase n=1 Tax=Actinophytocola glycyrrhizae TaxID=2044873 RepID=A0ABV9S864_9PSEU